MRRAAKTELGRDRAGQILIDFLVDRFTYHSRSEWISLVACGQVRVNGSAGEGDRELSAGDTVEFIFPHVEEPDVCLDFGVIYEDEHLLVVCKPANLPCHPSGKYFQNTLWTLLRERHGLSTVRFVNRLDRETSGLVLVAKTPDAARLFSRADGSEPIEKTYCVLVEGNFPDGTVTAEGWLARDLNSPVRKKRRFISDAAPGEGTCGDTESSCTHLRTICSTGALSLLEARLITGRTHQIRATLASLGFPVVGDKLYGVDDTMFLRFIDDLLTDEDRARLRIGRQALHAWRLRFAHPVTRREVFFEAEIPVEMLQFFPQVAVRSNNRVTGTLLSQ